MLRRCDQDGVDLFAEFIEHHPVVRPKLDPVQVLAILDLLR